jgi:hypothetical protein
MKTFSQFVGTRKDHELVETILSMGLDPQAVFETYYHVVRHHYKNGTLNETTLREGWWDMAKGMLGGAASVAASPFVGAAKAVKRGVQAGAAKANQIYKRNIEPARLNSAINDLAKFRQRLEQLGVIGTDPTVDAGLNSGFDGIKNALTQALQTVNQQGEEGRAPWNATNLPTAPNARNAVQGAVRNSVAPPSAAATAAYTGDEGGGVG